MFPGVGMREALKISQLLFFTGKGDFGNVVPVRFFLDSQKKRKKKINYSLAPAKWNVGKTSWEGFSPQPEVGRACVLLVYFKCGDGPAGWLDGWLAGSLKWAETEPFVGYEVAKVARTSLLWCLQSKQLFQKMLATLYFLLEGHGSTLGYMWLFGHLDWSLWPEKSPNLAIFYGLHVVGLSKSFLFNQFYWSII